MKSSFNYRGYTIVIKPYYCEDKDQLRFRTFVDRNYGVLFDIRSGFYPGLSNVELETKYISEGAYRIKRLIDKYIETDERLKVGEQLVDDYIQREETIK